mmetsp:Transcript_28009/g.79159  ORF Transcript_28009/g.79159 Transcript_28009/m.79159 type:complete len:298 (+) Transcript_28009:494-1387(+)
MPVGTPGRGDRHCHGPELDQSTQERLILVLREPLPPVHTKLQAAAGLPLRRLPRGPLVRRLLPVVHDLGHVLRARLGLVVLADTVQAHVLQRQLRRGSLAVALAAASERVDGAVRELPDAELSLLAHVDLLVRFQHRRRCGRPAVPALLAPYLLRQRRPQAFPAVLLGQRVFPRVLQQRRRLHRPGLRDVGAPAPTVERRELRGRAVGELADGRCPLPVRPAVVPLDRRQLGLEVLAAHRELGGPRHIGAAVLLEEGLERRAGGPALLEDLVGRGAHAEDRGEERGMAAARGHHRAR